MGDVLTLSVQDLIDVTPSSSILLLGLDEVPFAYRAGQAVMLGIHGQPLRRPYSIACAPAVARRRRQLEFLIKLDQDRSPGMHFAGLAPGARVDLEGPFGSLHIPDGPLEKRLLFIAGGTGIAPLRAMMQEALESGWEGRTGLLYSARAPGEFAYLSELRQLARAGLIELKLTVTRATDAEWPEDRGRINLQRLAPMVRDPSMLCFICGPPALLETVPLLLRRLGIPSSRIHMEAW